MSDAFTAVMSNLVMSSPIFIVYLIGLIVCAQRWQRHPRVCMLLASGLVFLIAASLVGSFGYLIVRQLMQTNDRFTDSTHIALRVLHGIAVLLDTTGIALILCGAFAGRQLVDETVHPL